MARLEEGEAVIEHFYQHTDGNFSFEDLYRYAAKTAEFGQCVEIGVANGRSAAFLAVELINHCHVKPQLSLVELSHGNMAAALSVLAPVMDKIDVRSLLGNSWDMADAFPPASVDFVFVDGDHSYESVLKDIKAWLPKVRPGGILAGHDFYSVSTAGVCDEMPGVARAVIESFDKFELWRGSQWTNGKWTGVLPSWMVRV